MDDRMPPPNVVYMALGFKNSVLRSCSMFSCRSVIFKGLNWAWVEKPATATLLTTVVKMPPKKEPFQNPSLPNTLWVGVWTHKHLLRRPLGGPNTYSQGIWGILED